MQAEIDGEQMKAEASVSRVTESEHRIACIEQNGVRLYHADDTIFLENGKAYSASGLFPDYSDLLEQSLDIYGITEVSGVKRSDGTTYTITAVGSGAMELLSLLLPSYADRLSSAESVSIDLVEADGALSSIHFSGSGILYGGTSATVSVAADLSILSSDAAASIPQEVLYAVLENDGRNVDLSDDVFRLVRAWAELEARDPLYADIHLSADCGPLLTDDALEYFRLSSDGTEISCVRKNSLSVYFAAEQYCHADGSPASAAEVSMAGCAQLLNIAYETCLNGDVGCEGTDGSYSYTLFLDEEGMAAAAKAIVSDAEDMDIAFGSGSIQIDMDDDAISAIRFSVEGSTQIVMVETDVSLAAELAFDADTADKDCSVPVSVAKALKE